MNQRIKQYLNKDANNRLNVNVVNKVTNASKLIVAVWQLPVFCNEKRRKKNECNHRNEKRQKVKYEKAGKSLWDDKNVILPMSLNEIFQPTSLFNDGTCFHDSNYSDNN